MPGMDRYADAIKRLSLLPMTAVVIRFLCHLKMMTTRQFTFTPLMVKTSFWSRPLFSHLFTDCISKTKSHQPAIFNRMLAITIKWVSHQDGGRRSSPPGGTWYATPRFPSDANVWSLVFELAAAVETGDGPVSSGHVRFLMDNAPVERLRLCTSFAVYKGPHRVGDGRG